MLERLAVHAADSGRRIHVVAIDRVEVGAGRVWRTSQPDWFVMNTVAGQVTMYSADRDGGPDRPGHGPSLAEWLAEHPDPRLAAIGPDGYAPRAAYGHYLREVYGNLLERLPEGLSVEEVSGQVAAVQRTPDGRFSLQIENGAHSRPTCADHVVLATGHPLIDPSGTVRELKRHATRHPRLRFIAGDSAADMPLDSIGAGETVGVIGLGLSFYDVVLTLTVGRGGRFEETGSGLRYVPSGREPRIVAGSRSGLPIAARGVNQKAPNHVHSAVVFTADRVRAYRDEIDGAGAPLNFRRHIMPFIQAEIDHKYLTLLVRDARGPAPAERFAEQHAEYLAAGLPTGPLRRSFGVPDDATLDIEALARPFAGRTFTDEHHFRSTLLDLVRTDIAEAKRGTLNGPIKAALDVLRDIRNTVRDLVDFGGLDPASHRDDFEGWYVPINALLSAGPPLE
ncbi:MAG TPA: FAD/NAD(P)-binding protein, partial [Micromonosporaceae bacterium]